LRDWIFLGPALAVAALLQITSMLYIFSPEIKPDLCLAIVVWAARQKTFKTGALFAFVTGLLTDLLSVSPTGLFAVFYLLVFLVINHLYGIISFEGAGVMSVLVLFSSWVSSVYTLAFRSLQGALAPGLETLETLILKSFLTALFSLPVFFILDSVDPKPNRFLEQV
jgi:rod shape-determining protein MreD